MPNYIQVFASIVIDDEVNDPIYVDELAFKLFEAEDPQKVQDFINSLPGIRDYCHENETDNIAVYLKGMPRNGMPVAVEQQIYKYLDAEGRRQELTIATCPICHGEVGVDSAFLDQVSDEVTCPYCLETFVMTA